MDKKNRDEKSGDMKGRMKTQVSNLIHIVKESKKILIVLVVFAVIIGAAVAFIDFSEKKEEVVVNSTNTVEDSTTEETVDDSPVVQEEALEKDAYVEVNTLVKQYYQALVDGDMETIRNLKSFIGEEEELKIVKKSEFIESYPNIVVYTKKGPEENSFVAYVQYDVKFFDIEATAPGLSALYICQNEEGNYYINSGKVDETVGDYLKMVSAQNDVMDLVNKVEVAYNEVKEENVELSAFLDELPILLTEAVGEAIAEQEAIEEASQPQEEAEIVMEVVKTVKTTEVVNVRNSDSIEADKLGKTSKGQVLDLIEERLNGWSKVKFDGKEGFVKTEFLEPYETETVVTAPGTETENQTEESTEEKPAKGKLTETVNVRKTASTDGDRLGKLDKGSTVEIIEKMNNGWTKIKYNDGEAYVKSDYVE